jgi:hypothetical protein
LFFRFVWIYSVIPSGARNLLFGPGYLEERFHGTPL